MRGCGFPLLASGGRAGRAMKAALSGFFPVRGEFLALPDSRMTSVSSICIVRQDSHTSGIQDIR